MNKRQLRAVKIFENGGIQQLTKSTFIVNSQTEKGKKYKVQWMRNKWVCTCTDYKKTGKTCKHIHGINFFLALSEIKFGVKNWDKDGVCPTCKKKNQTIKRGFRYSRSGPRQIFFCKRCKKRFCAKQSFKKMKHRATVITTALDLYFRGLSLRQVVQHLETSHHVTVSHGTVYYWLRKYVRMVSDFVDGLPGTFSHRWHADETLLKIRDKHILLWILLDHETRYVIATHLSEKRGIKDASILMKKARWKRDDLPQEIVTDGLASYTPAIKQGLNPSAENPIIHLQSSLSKSLNNRIERFNGVLKNRVKTMSLFQNQDSISTFVQGYMLHHNFVKNHSSLGQRTPAEMANIIPKKYTWLDLITQSQQTMNNTNK